MTDVDEHYAKQLGGVPKPISGLRAHAPEFFAGMATARRRSWRATRPRASTGP